jgi:uncharacterized protein YbbC (DUF1343 family)
MAVRTGLDRLVAEGFASLRGKRVGLVCHAASVASDLGHLTEHCRAAGVNVVRCFGPEHGIWADAQDMIAVDDETTFEPVTGAPVHSLYGHDEASLEPRVEHLREVDVLLVDLQDVGARYYTFVYTAALCARAAAKAGCEVWVLDRPNPLGGAAVEGGLQDPGYLSFVGLWPLPVRHGLTIGEVVTLLNAREGFGARLRVVGMEGWRRGDWFEATGLPWVQPSPNMPTVDTAAVYPGMCLIEGTNLSEGRGTTRPFELVGADFIEPFVLAPALNALDLPGIRFRPVFFRPTFHKFGGRAIGGVALHVTDRAAFQPFRAGLLFLATVRRLYGEKLQWRTEAYEFVRDRLAFDLLCGGPQMRETIDALGDVDALWRAGQAEAAAFEQARAPFLLYRE